MSYNGDGAMAKRQRTDMDGMIQRDHAENYNKNYEPRRKRPEADPNNVLLFTIFNPVYPITVDVLHTICTPNGQVLRIVIFKKNGVQAMVDSNSTTTMKRILFLDNNQQPSTVKSCLTARLSSFLNAMDHRSQPFQTGYVKIDASQEWGPGDDITIWKWCGTSLKRRVYGIEHTRLTLMRDIGTIHDSMLVIELSACWFQPREKKKNLSIPFETIETAKRVKEALNGADIYSGCCTLKIEFAKPSKLNVYKNDMDSWDYTNPSGVEMRRGSGDVRPSYYDFDFTLDDDDGSPFLPSTFPYHLPCWNLYPLLEKPPEPAPHRAAPLLQEPRFGAPPQLYPRGMRPDDRPPFDLASPRSRSPPSFRGERGGRPGPRDDHLLPPPFRGPKPFRGGPGGSSGGFVDYDDGYTNGRPSAYGDYVSERFPAPVENRFLMKGVAGGREGLVAPPPPPPRGAASSYAGLAPSNGIQGGTGCVLMAYGLDPQQANPDRLFNLFCLYGNVIRIKFLKTKEGCAMIQMGDSISVERCINHLKNAPLFGGVLQLGFSKQTYLSEVALPYNLPDNSPSFKDYTNNKNNRFMNPAMASKNRIQGPAKILHFFNTPPDITEEQLIQVIEEKEVKKPSQVKLFPKKGDRSSSGLVEFDTLEDAVNCLVICNHMPIKNAESKFPYVLKLCFSSTRSIVAKDFAKEDPQMQ